MGRNGLLGCCCPCFSSGNPAPSSSDKIFADSSADSGSSSDSEVPSSRIQHQVPSCKLLPLPPHRAFPHHAVGIDDQVNCVIRLLEWENETNTAVAVILHGLGGTGKSTIADAVVARLDIQRWKCCTIVPDGEGEIQDVCEVEEEQAFIYIDNVMVRGEHLQKLLPNSYKKLRLLLTARDETVADVIAGCGFHTHVYPVRPLTSQDAMELLCIKMGVAAGNHHASQINEILEICDGVPLVLERVGAYICQSLDKDEAYRRVIEWSKDGEPFTSSEEYSIEKNGLLFDLEDLPASAKEPFLDICSFFNGWDWDKVSSIMGEDELNSLRNRALLLQKEEHENKVMIRPIISTIGRHMTKGKRFTSVHDLSKVLEGNEMDIQGIKGIWLQDNMSEPFLMSAEKLDLMHNSLRVLALGDMTIVVDGQCCTQKFKQIIYFEAGLIPYIPFHPTKLQELSFLDWLPHKSNDLQLTKMSSKLKVLSLNGARYARRFDTASVFGRLRGLRTLKLAEFKKLKILPEELSLLTQLEELDLTGCGKLGQLPKGLGSLKALTKLILQSCWSLQELPDSFGKLGSLKYLDLSSCGSLKQLPEDFGSLSCLEELDLGSVPFKELPSSFENLSSLKVLNLERCRSLNYLPGNIGNLSALVRIKFQGSSLKSIPEEFCSYLKLVKAFSSCESLTNLPNRLVELASLTSLDLHYCKSLERLPEGFGQLKSLAELNLQYCSSLQQLSADFHCLASLQILNMRSCEKLEGKWMDSVGKIKTLDLVDIEYGSQMLLKRWAEMEMEKEKAGESWQFAVRTDSEKWKNILNKAASKLFTRKCLLTDSREEPFSLSAVAPNTLLLVIYERNEPSWEGPWRLLEEVVMRHQQPLMPFQIIYVGKYFGKLSKNIADRILAYASEESDARLLYNVLKFTGDDTFQFRPKSVVTEVVADEKGRKHFSTWEDITYSYEEFFLSHSRLYSDIQKLTETPQESNDKLLRALFDPAESRTSSVFLRNYTQNMGVDQLRGKTVLLLISVMDEHPFQSLKEIHSKVESSDNLEILSIPIPVEVRGRRQARSEDEVALLPDSDLAGFESILRNVSWPVLRNPWLLKTEVYYFFEREWGELNPAILVVVDPNGRICNKNALPLIETWGAQVYPFTQEKMKQLESEPLEEHLSEYILNGVLEKWSN